MKKSSAKVYFDVREYRLRHTASADSKRFVAIARRAHRTENGSKIFAGVVARARVCMGVHALPRRVRHITRASA